MQSADHARPLDTTTFGNFSTSSLAPGSRTYSRPCLASGLPQQTPFMLPTQNRPAGSTLPSFHLRGSTGARGSLPAHLGGALNFVYLNSGPLSASGISAKVTILDGHVSAIMDSIGTSTMGACGVVTV